MANLFEPEFDESIDRPGYRWQRAFLGRQVGAERLGASLLALAPDSAAFPMHYHLGNEEMLIVIAGRPSLRTPDDERELEVGEVVSFPRGTEGAHQVVNRSEEEARILLISEMNAPEVVVRPESKQLSAMERPPGSRGEGIHKIFMLEDEVEFWDAHEPPPER